MHNCLTPKWLRRFFGVAAVLALGVGSEVRAETTLTLYCKPKGYESSSKTGLLRGTATTATDSKGVFVCESDGGYFAIHSDSGDLTENGPFLSGSTSTVSFPLLRSIEFSRGDELWAMKAGSEAFKALRSGDVLVLTFKNPVFKNNLLFAPYSARKTELTAAINAEYYNACMGARNNARTCKAEATAYSRSSEVQAGLAYASQTSNTKLNTRVEITGADQIRVKAVSRWSSYTFNTGGGRGAGRL